jgi:hypothetical protein
MRGAALALPRGVSIDAMRKWPAHKWIVVVGSIITLPHKANELFYQWQVAKIERFVMHWPVLKSTLGLAVGRTKTRCTDRVEWRLAKLLSLSEELAADADHRRVGRLELAVRRLVWTEWITRNLSPREAFALWVNGVYLGHGTWGVEAAARTYFEKEVSDLTLSQLVVLAGLPRSPSRSDPCRHPDRARERRTYLLKRLGEEGVISAADGEAALGDPIDTGLHCSPPRAPVSGAEPR